MICVVAAFGQIVRRYVVLLLIVSPLWYGSGTRANLISARLITSLAGLRTQ